MSKSVTLNVSNTAGGVAPTLTGIAKNYGADFVKKFDTSDKLVVANLTSPTDAPNTEQYSLKVVSDIYKGSPVTDAYKSPNKGGWSLLSQSNIVATITDSEDSTYRVDLPISANVMIKGPNDSNITVAHLTEVLMRAIGGLYETTGAIRVASLVRGGMTPADL